MRKFIIFMAYMTIRACFSLSDILTIELWGALLTSLGASMITSGTGLAKSGTWFDVFWSHLFSRINTTKKI